MGDQREKVLKKRYFREGETTDVELFNRVATFLSDNEKEKDEFFNIMKESLFLPNTPCLVNAGVPSSPGQLFACFVLPVEDNMDSIFQTLHHTALIHKSGGGTGFNFGKLRPKDAKVKSTQGVASGPISFMKVYNSATEEVKQGGVRRGANMGMMPVTHPDIVDFITCKDDLSTLNNFNISVALTSEFMESVKNDSDWYFSFKNKVDKANPIKARKLMKMIAHQAWKNGEPGICFIDNINETHPLPEIIDSTNPCGEQPLLPYESCCLGSVNLSNMVNEKGDFNFKKFKNTISVGVNMLNKMLDKNIYPLDKIKDMSSKNRKIGLGVMGYADMLIKMGLKYGSEEALNFTETLAKSYQKYSEEASTALAIKDGCFENWETSDWNKKYNKKMRNATVTTIAPTGSISIIAECSSGIEPIFSVVTEINRVGEKFVEVHPYIKECLKKENLYDKFIRDEERDLFNYLPEIAELIVTAQELDYKKHIKTQAIWQKYTHNAVSKTINMPEDATEDDVYNAYMMAYDFKCKGLTIYRDGSRQNQVLNTSTNEKKKDDKMQVRSTPRKRPHMTKGFTVSNNIGCGKLYVTVNSDEHGICEIFTNTGKSGGCPSQSEATARMISIALRSGVPISEIIYQLKGIRCSACIRKNGVDVLSCPDAIARTLESVEIQNGNSISSFKSITYNKKLNNDGICPECGGDLKMESGCKQCLECGYSKCG